MIESDATNSTGAGPARITQLGKLIGWSPSNTGVELLGALAESGSINSAARSLGMSYKSAWQKLDQINNLLPYPLFIKQTGGSGGGGTQLTEEGRRLLTRVELLNKEFGRFLEFFADEPEEALATLKTLRRIEMQLSARNVWLGTVHRIERGSVNSVVTVRLKGGDRITSMITANSVSRLGLQEGSEVTAIVKASNVLLGHQIDPDRLSARNILTGRISRIIAGAVNDDITVQLPGGSSVAAIITSASVQRLGLAEGVTVSAVIKASDVLLALS